MSNPNVAVGSRDWRDSLGTALVACHSPLTILQAMQTVVIRVEIRCGTLKKEFVVPVRKLQDYQAVCNLVKELSMLQPAHNSIELEYNGSTTQIHPLSWVPLEELPGARILAELAKDAEVFIKATFRVVARVDDDGDDDDYDDNNDNNEGAAPATAMPQLKDTNFRPFFADYTPLGFDMQMLCEDIREHVRHCAFEALGRDRAVYLQLGENVEILCAIDRPPGAHAAPLEEVLTEGTNVHQRTICCNVSFPDYNNNGGRRSAGAAADLVRPSYYGGLPVV